MKTSPFDKIANKYDETRGGVDARRHFAVYLEPWLVPGPVLEIGVGTGLISAVLLERGYPAYGVDMSLPMLARAYERLGGRVVNGDACALPIADGVLSNTVFAAALHAIRNVPGAFSEAARVLRSGGRLLATYGQPIIEPESGGTDDIMETLAPLEKLDAFIFPDSRESVDAAAHAAGLTPVCHTVSPKRLRSSSPERFAELLENRVYSFLSYVDDDSWNGVVVPVIHRLRALPEPDRPRPRNHSYSIAVYER